MALTLGNKTTTKQDLDDENLNNQTGGVEETKLNLEEEKKWFQGVITRFANKVVSEPTEQNIYLGIRNGGKTIINLNKNPHQSGDSVVIGRIGKLASTSNHDDGINNIILLSPDGYKLENPNEFKPQEELLSRNEFDKILIQTFEKMVRESPKLEEDKSQKEDSLPDDQYLKLFRTYARMNMMNKLPGTGFYLVDVNNIINSYSVGKLREILPDEELAKAVVKGIK